MNFGKNNFFLISLINYTLKLSGQIKSYFHVVPDGQHPRMAKELDSVCEVLHLISVLPNIRKTCKEYNMTK